MKHLTTACTQGHSDSDFVCPLCDKIGKHTIKSDCSQCNGQSGKQRQEQMLKRCWAMDALKTSRIVRKLSGASWVATANRSRCTALASERASPVVRTTQITGIIRLTIAVRPSCT